MAFTFRTRAAAVIGAVCLLGTTGCGSSSSGKAKGGAEVVSKGNLTVCTHLSYKPFEYKDSNGKVIGFDVDMADLAAKRLGLKTKIVDVDFAQITSGAVFPAKKCDVAMGAMTITPERQKAATFSTPYFNATQALLAPKSAGVKDLSSLKGKKIGVQTDTTGQLYAQKYAKQYGYDVVVFDDLPTSLTGLTSKRVDAVINDNGPLNDFAKDHSDLAVVKEFNTGEQYGFNAAKTADGKKLMKQVDAAFKQAISGPEYKSIYKKWFGVEPAQLPKA